MSSPAKGGDGIQVNERCLNCSLRAQSRMIPSGRQLGCGRRRGGHLTSTPTPSCWAHGEARGTTRLIPFAVDGLIYASSMAMLDSPAPQGTGTGAGAMAARACHRSDTRGQHRAQAQVMASLGRGRGLASGRTSWIA